MKVIYGHLHQSLLRLKSNYSLARSHEGREKELFTALRDGAIQSFEFTYEMAVRSLERAVEDRVGVGRFDAASFRERLRMAWEAELITDIGPWLDFREMRNRTSHTYDEAKAKFVYSGIPGFIAATEQLLLKLEAHDAVGA